MLRSNNIVTIRKKIQVTKFIPLPFSDFILNQIFSYTNKIYLQIR